MTNDTQEPENIRDEDFRLQAITTLAKDFSTPGGPLHKEGAAVMVVANTKFQGKNLTFGLPNVSAMFLNFSNTLWCESELYFNDASNFSTPTSKFMLPNTQSMKDKKSFFDALEKRMGAVVFAYSALESFANQSIPADFVFRQERGDAKFLEEYNKGQIEKFLNLDIKLGDVLPRIFEVSSPKGKKVWSEYVDLKKLRDRIIHPKSDDVKSTDPDVKTLWTALLDRRSANPAIETKDLVAHFFPSHEKRPRWLKKCPF